MSDIQTWHERAMAHPDHQSGMISEGMLRARMAEEIADLRAEVERLTAQIVALEATGAEASDEIDRLRAEMLDLAEWCETEEPLSYKKLTYRLRAALEAKL